MQGSITEATLQLIKEAQADDVPGLLQKAGWVQSGSAISGLTAYDLEGVIQTVPFLTPLRDSIPRVSGKGGIQANWRAVTAVNTANIDATVAEGKRGGTVATGTADFLAAYKGIGLEDQVTFEAGYAADGYDDLRARAAANLLRTLMIGEEPLLLGGLGTFALGTTPTPVAALNTDSTSAMTARSVLGFCIALTYAGFTRATVGVNGVIDQVTRTNAGPYASSDVINAGHAAISAVSNTVITDATHKSVTWTVPAVPGAYAYAWYSGITNAAGCKIAGITTVNKFVQTADEGGGNQAANAAGLSSDRSQNSLAFDGLTSIAAKAGSNAYYKSVDGAALTFDNAGGCVELDNALIDRWNNFKMSFTDLWLSGNDIVKFSKGVMTGGATSTLTSVVVMQQNVPSNQFSGAGGLIAKDYLNKVTGRRLDVHVHPNLTAGKLLLTSRELPYTLNGIPAVFRVLTRQDYYQVEWPRLQRAYEYGVYADEVLQHFFPPSLGIIDNAVLA